MALLTLKLDEARDSLAHVNADAHTKEHRLQQLETAIEKRTNQLQALHDDLDREIKSKKEELEVRVLVCSLRPSIEWNYRYSKIDV